MAALIGLLAGALIGHAAWREWGAIVGGLVGFFVGATMTGKRLREAYRKPAAAITESPVSATLGHELALGERVTVLEQRIAVLERALGTAHAVGPESGTAAASAQLPVAGMAASPAAGESTAAATGPIVPQTPPDVAPEMRPLPEPGPAALSSILSLPDTVAASKGMPGTNPLWAWVSGGNALTRVGVVVLFFGVAFLLRYFAEHVTLPIELKLSAVATVGVALIGLGLRIASARPGYGLSLQGAGAGILYLTTYAAFRLYAVLPDAAAIALLIAVAGLTVWLALRADSQPLAGLAIGGGFLAPMLASTHGAPLPLFGYFAVLNGVIFALAWRRAWRALNVLGFACTFALGLFWGQRYYAPEHFATVEPFLALFFAFYLAIAVLEARRGTLEAKNPVDGLLVFGVPLAGFALQAALVRDSRYGAAWSALALALVYGVLFATLRRRTEPGLALAARAFLALAVIFATLAIPFAFDDQWTAALWAIEAAGVYWLGIRQSSRLARGFALLVELGAGVAFIGSGAAEAGEPLFANAHFIGAMLIALSALATALIADRADPALPARERPLTPLAFGWGVIWWLGAGGLELVRYLAAEDEAHAVLAWVTASIGLALVLSRMLHWSRLATAGVALLPAMSYVALRDFESARTTLTIFGWLVWPAAWVAHWLVLRAADTAQPADRPAGRAPPGASGMLGIAHTVSALALTAQVAWEASEWVGRSTPLHTAWVACAAALPAIACLWIVTRWHGDQRWPFSAHGDAYAIGAGSPIAALLAVWFFAVNALSPGDASPLPYFPLANPLDLTLALALAALFGWARRFAHLRLQTLYGWLVAALFVAGNGVVLRTAHHWGDVPWRLPALLASKPLQAGLTLTWTVTALAVMFAATRRGLRPLWIVGAGLLAVVVGKLFLIDLGALAGLPRVVAFLGVGILLLVIGYLSPLPPAASDDAVGAPHGPPG